MNTFKDYLPKKCTLKKYLIKWYTRTKELLKKCLFKMGTTKRYFFMSRSFKKCPHR
jgi:hypothetical protein